ncbi:heterokaryon incompatibility protein-domain-containing protein [Ilyonectria destructans]|nr:heterokaryon incompatibility protein-domain-containing protein [Ilyonectria destructans]
MSIFQPLDTKVDSIRLLVLLPASAGGEICCELEHQTFAGKPTYEALSYAWSEGPADHPIKVNGEEVLIGANLHNALQAFHLPSRRVLWVDALCINLADTEERNYQANMMPYIYSRAAMVLAWLGPARNRFTKDELKDMESPRSRWYVDWSEANRVAVAKSPYWSRRWTIQELVLAKEIHFHLGAGFFTIDEYDKLSIGDESKPISDRLVLITATRKNQGSNIQRLEVLLESYSDLKCRETRDKVFSLIGIADDTAQLMIEVDYNMGYSDMYTKLIEYHQASTSLPRRPSCFMRDFDFGPWTDKNRTTEFAEGIERSVRLVSFSHLVQKTLEGFIDENRAGMSSSTVIQRTFVARGAFAGKILRLGPTYNEIVSSWEPNKRWRAAIEDECSKDPNVVEIRRANAEYSRSILTWDENHIRAIRMVDSPTSYGYRNSANDEVINRPDSSQVAEGSEPKLFLATQGLMGFVPPQARPGDLIYSFWECTVGFVVRNVADDRWMIVGRADLSRETLPGILDKDYFTDSLNHGTEKESYAWRKGTDYYRECRQQALENMLDFKLDLSTLQQLTA